MVEEYIKLADICVKTYVQFNRNGEFTLPRGYRKISDFKAELFGEEEWFGFILESEEEVIVSFRGTVSDSNWLADSLAFHKDFPYAENCGKVHLGFLKIYASCREELFNGLKEIDRTKKVIITGHSLGAALATIFAIDFAKNSSFENIKLINFASPRVGNQKFCNAVNKELAEIVRIVNVHDVVTLLPPIVIPLPCLKTKGIFRHVKGKFKIDVQKNSFFGNHNIGTYMTGLKKLRSN
jgi:triacylglycerol lipase